jgi:uncharacterized protein YhfF
MLDGAGTPCAILETAEMTRRRFGEVDSAFAVDEGEGDRTLEWWRGAHRRNFTRQGTFTLDVHLYCERFRVLAIV